MKMLFFLSLFIVSLLETAISQERAELTKVEKQNLDIARQFFTEVLGNGKVEKMNELVDEKAQITTGLKVTGPIDGREEYKQIFGGFRDAFPHVEPLKILDMFVSGERVVTRFHSRQKHSKDYYGIKATNRVILFDEVHVMKIKNGKIVENIVSATNLEFEMLMAPALTPLILK